MNRFLLVNLLSILLFSSHSVSASDSKDSWVNEQIKQICKNDLYGKYVCEDGSGISGLLSTLKRYDQLYRPSEAYLNPEAPKETKGRSTDFSYDTQDKNQGLNTEDRQDDYNYEPFGN